MVTTNDYTKWSRESLLERIEELEYLLDIKPCGSLRIYLSVTEHKVLRYLVSRHGIVRQNELFAAIWGGRPECDTPQCQVVSVYICKLRKRLHPHDIEIKTEWGVGFYMTTEMKERARMMVLPEDMPPSEDRLRSNPHAQAQMVAA